MAIESQKQHETLLDCMRGIAALLVCAGHLRNAVFVDWGNALNHSIIQGVLYGLTGLGHQAVVIFFVLSGYLVGGSVISSAATFKWSDYLIARLCRLWVVLLPCLALTAAIDSLTAQVAGDVLSGAFAERWHSAPVSGQYSASWVTLLGNIVFVQTIFVPVFGTNGPLWSLANEFWYYVLFPLSWASIIAMRERRMLRWSVNICLFLAVFFFLPVDVKWGFLVWALGAIVCLLNRSVRRFELPEVVWVLSFMTMALGLAFSKWSTTRGWLLPWGDFVLGLTVAAFLLSALRKKSKNPGRESARGISKINIIRGLSDISFSLYLSHFPMIMLIAAFWFHNESMQPSLGAWLVYLAILIGLLMSAVAMWWLFERNTSAIRRCVVRILKQHKLSAHPVI